MESEGMCVDDSASDSRWGRGRVGEGEAHTHLPEIAQWATASYRRTRLHQCLPLDLNSPKIFAFPWCRVFPFKSCWSPNALKKKKKKTVFEEAELKATVCGCQRTRAGRSVGSQLLFTSAPALTLHVWRHDPVLSLTAGRREDGQVLWDLLLNPHFLRPYLYTQKCNPRSSQKPIPRLGRVRCEFSDNHTEPDHSEGNKKIIKSKTHLHS